jgi:hypothetical protein
MGADEKLQRTECPHPPFSKACFIFSHAFIRAEYFVISVLSRSISAWALHKQQSSFP